MTDWPIGISTGCFYHTPITQVLRDIRDGGFTLIEICSFPHHLHYRDPAAVRPAAAAIREHGLEPFSFHAPFAEDIDITALDPDARRQALDALFAACEAAATLGAHHLVLHPGPEREGKPPVGESFPRMHHGAETLNKVASRCRELGLFLLLENMLPHLLFGHTSDILYMLGAIRETNVGTCLDTGHANLSGDLLTVVHKLSGHLRMIHANDNRNDHDAHLPPGEGNIDWFRLVQELSASRFQGTIILELAGSKDLPPSGVLERARRGRHYFQEVCRRVDVPPQTA
ncbi:hypothetical protein BH23VER1_BH23VER1_04050 [soil metagenome]